MASPSMPASPQTSTYRVELEDGRVFDVEVEGTEPPSEDEVYAHLEAQETPKGKPGLTSPTLALRDKRVVRDMTDPSLMPQSTVEGDPDPHMYEDAGTYAAHTVGNIGPSAVNAAQGIGSFLFKGMQAMAGNTEAGMEAIDALRSVPGALANRYGGVENIKRTLHDDPVGMAADVATAGSVATAGARTAARFPGRVVDTAVGLGSGRPWAALRGAAGHGPVDAGIGFLKKVLSESETAPASATASPVAQSGPVAPSVPSPQSVLQRIPSEVASAAPLVAPTVRLWHGSPKNLTELQPGSMVTSDQSWASGYTTKVADDLSETFVGALHESAPISGPTVSARTLHGAEGQLLQMGRQFLNREPRTLREAAEAVAANTDLSAIVVRKDGVITDAIVLRPTPVASTADPVLALERAVAEGRQIPSNLSSALSARGKSVAPVSPVASHPVAPAPSAAPSVPEAAAVRPATPKLSPQMIQNELGIQARRQKVTLTEPQYKAATALVDQGLTPAEAVAQVAKQVSEAPATATPTAAAPEAQARAKTATKRAKLTADEAGEYLRLTGRGMSHEDAVAALMQQRTLAKKLGTPDNETVRRRVATRNQTGRWPK